MNCKARLAIHGGSGAIDRASLGAVRDRRYREALGRVIRATWERLRSGVTAVDAVEHAVRLLEDCEYFNAGRGAVLNRDGEVEMDAAIMDGSDRRCGAVAATRTPRNAISLARAVMEHSQHVLLVGTGADHFATEVGQCQEQPSYFVTAPRRQQLTIAASAGEVNLDHDEYGTVGAVARDREGRLASATSTGGMTNKPPGRVGDSPLIGCGTWADNTTCALSGTGHGEYFMRTVLGYSVHARMAYGRLSLNQAAADALGDVARMGGVGGLIAVGRDGEIALPFNTRGMYRAWVGEDDVIHVAIYDDERCA